MSVYTVRVRFILSLALLGCLLAGCEKPKTVVQSDEGGPQEAARPARRGVEVRPAREVTFAANDGSKVFADLYTSNADSRWLVVLFHQAGSNAAEYASIAPRIAALGLDALAVDLRSGGRLWEADNRTAATYESPQPYEASLPDMEAALDWAAAQGKYSRVVVWGSSYTASLALKLVARPEIAGMILSSPGEYFPNESVAEWAKAADRFPILITASPEEAEDDERSIFDAMPTPPGPAPHRLVHHEGGIHGASTADPDRCEAADRYWSDVRGYFELLRPRRPVEFQGATRTTTD